MPLDSVRAGLMSRCPCQRAPGLHAARALMMASPHSSLAAVSRRMPCISASGASPAAFFAPPAAAGGHVREASGLPRPVEL